MSIEYDKLSKLDRKNTAELQALGLTYLGTSQVESTQYPTEHFLFRPDWSLFVVTPESRKPYYSDLDIEGALDNLRSHPHSLRPKELGYLDKGEQTALGNVRSFLLPPQLLEMLSFYFVSEGIVDISSKNQIPRVSAEIVLPHGIFLTRSEEWYFDPNLGWNNDPRSPMIKAVLAGRKIQMEPRKKEKVSGSGVLPYQLEAKLEAELKEIGLDVRVDHDIYENTVTAYEVSIAEQCVIYHYSEEEDQPLTGEAHIDIVYKRREFPGGLPDILPVSVRPKLTL